MINTEKLEKILRKKKDKIPALLEILRLTANLCKVLDNVFDTNFNIALDKVENLLFLQAQSKKTMGYILKDSDYKALGIFEWHLRKLRRKSKESQKQDKFMNIMPKLYQIQKERNFSYRELHKYAEEKYKISISLSYFYEIYKKVNGI